MAILPAINGRVLPLHWRRSTRSSLTPAPGVLPQALHEAAEQSLLIIRPCFMAIRRAQRLTIRPTGIVLVDEPGRALTSTDVERALGVGVVAEVRLDPAVARAVDAGLLIARLPRSLSLSLRTAA